MAEPASYITSFRLTPSERDRIRSFARQHGRIPTSAIIRQAITEFLERHEGEGIEGSAVRLDNCGAPPLSSEQLTFNQKPLR